MSIPIVARPMMTGLVLGFVVLVAATEQRVGAEDWPQWRGVQRDAVIRDDVELVDELPAGSIPRKWTTTIGPGYSGPTVAGGRVYVSDRGQESSPPNVERVLCFDAASGESLWTFTYEAPYTISYTAGPRASVTIHDGKAIAVGAMGHMHCLDAKSGEVLWKHDLAEEYDVRMPIWGIAGAPLVYKESVIQIVGGAGDSCVVAFDLATGNERWRSIDERAAYSSPILIRQGSTDVVVCWTGESVSGLDPSTGKRYWSHAMLPRNMPIGVPTPITDGRHLFVSSFYDGSMLIRLDAAGPTSEKVWHRVGVDEKNTDALQSIIATPIIKDDHIYGVDSYGELRCLRIADGERVWEDQTAVPRNRWGTIHIIRKGDREIMLNDQGELILASLTPTGYVEHSRSKLLAPTRLQLNRRDGVTWAHPAIADGVIYARSDNELVAASLRAKSAE